MDVREFTLELKSIFEYINEVLVKTYPTNIIEIEYVITAILDKNKSHAYIILDNCLTNSNINNLKKIFDEYLSKNVKINPVNTEVLYNLNLENTINKAKDERRNPNELVGSEHLLLSILNPNNNNLKMQEIFKNMGIDYNFLRNKCFENIKQKNIEQIKQKLKQNMMGTPQIPLKSLVNPQGLTNTQNAIQQFTINLNKEASDGKIDELIGRDKEINRIVNVLARREKNNLILVGEGGCGKTAIVRGLAKQITEGNVPDTLKNTKVVQLNVAALVAGTYLRGAFEERVLNLFNEMKAEKNYLLLIDDMHTVLKSSSKEKDTDMSPMLNEVLSKNDIKIIGTTSFKEYRNCIENNTMISRRLHKMIIEPTTIEETVTILQNNKHYYEDYHNVTYTDEAITKCVELAEKYITDRCLPDSAIDILDYTGAKACVTIKKPQEIIANENRLKYLDEEKRKNLDQGNFEAINEIDEEIKNIKRVIADYERNYENSKKLFSIAIEKDKIFESVSELTKIPTQKLSVNDKKQLANIDKVLKEQVIGQDEAIDTICKSIKRNRIGLGNQNKPYGSFLFIAQTGVGKTFLAKKIAEDIFGDSKYLVRFDMSEYADKTSVNKLLGASSGYIGYAEGGLLTNEIKNKPYCVLLIDEIEKANSDIYNVFLQLLDEGTITDNNGIHVNCKNTIVIFTSNVGAQKADIFGKGVGFKQDESQNQKVILEKELKSTFKPEFLNRLDQIVYFNSLNEDNYREIVKLELHKVCKQINTIGYNIVYNNDVIEYIKEDALKDKKMGARPIYRYLQKEIVDLITELIISNDYPTNYTFNVQVNNGKIEIN